MVVEDTSDSTVNQAGGDLNITNITNISATSEQIKEIVTDTVRGVLKDEISKLEGEAEKTAILRRSEAEEKTIRSIESENKNLINRFKEPAIQFALNAIYKEYIKTDDVELGNGLIDMLIDRLNVDERTTEQFLIDEAIQILPKLTKAQLDFITIYVNVRYTYEPYSSEEFESNFCKFNSVIDSISEISDKDIDYLKHLSLFTATPGLSYEMDIYNRYRQNYKCIFSKGINIGDITTKYRSVPTEKWNGLLWKPPYYTDTVTIRTLTDDALKAIIIKEKLEQYESILFEILNSNLMSDDEIKSYFSRINNNWNVYFDFMKRNKKAKELVASQLAYYIGLKNVSKLMNREIPFDILYPNTMRRL